MSNGNGVGQSAYTKMKQDHFSRILGWQMNIAKRAMRNQRQAWHQTYLMIDATAGSGILDDGLHGSPLRFLEVAADKQVNW